MLLEFGLLSYDLGKSIFCFCIGVLILGGVWSQITCGVFLIAVAILYMVLHCLEKKHAPPEEDQAPADLPAFTGVEEPINPE